MICKPRWGDINQLIALALGIDQGGQDPVDHDFAAAGHERLLLVDVIAC
ncbi:MAG TPA: hypothetical protein VKE98_13155 [Gemmataceae bacterium]|nr:hypothetical protein [Gemmataceae bacterium]